MQRAQLVSLILQTVTDLADPEAIKHAAALDEHTPLFGRGGLFDSMGLISVVLAVEQEVNAATGAAVTVADDRAMSQTRSPFGTAGLLADYIRGLLDERGIA